jgi:RNA polymerase sigma-70 factor, ECF subfamily
MASSIARSVERRGLEEKAVVEALEAQVEHWQKRGEWTKLKCIELLFLCGWANKDVAVELGLSEQQVANYKFDFVARLRTIIRKQGLSPDVFPELYERLGKRLTRKRLPTPVTPIPTSNSWPGAYFFADP